MTISKKKIVHFVFHAIFLTVVHQSMSHLLVKGFKIGKELKMDKDMLLLNMKAMIMVHNIVLLWKNGII